MAAITAGLLAGGGGMAGADTSGEGGIGSGNQVAIPINAPINVSGNAIGLLGDAKARSSGKTVISGGGSPEMKTSGASGIGSGNQVHAPINAPITACGNAVALLGSANAGCTHSVKINPSEGGARPGKRKPRKAGKRRPGKGRYIAARHRSIKHRPIKHRSATHRPAGVLNTSGKHGVLSGNQVVAPINAPITLCGNAVGLLGSASAECDATVQASSGGPAGAGATTSGAGGILGGNQVHLPINVPITACGNAVGNATVEKCTVKTDTSTHGKGKGHKGKGHKGKGKGHHGHGHWHGNWHWHWHEHGSGGGHRPDQDAGSGNAGTGGGRGPLQARPSGVRFTDSGRKLPLTGAPIGLLASSGAAVLATGLGLIMLGRRRSAAKGRVPTSAAPSTDAPESGEGVRLLAQRPRRSTGATRPDTDPAE